MARLGASATAIRTDVADMASLDALFDTIRQRSGKIDVLVANAGSGAFEPLGAISEEQFDTTFCVNVKGTLFTVQNALPLLRDGEAVVLTSSDLTPEDGYPAPSGRMVVRVIHAWLGRPDSPSPPILVRPQRRGCQRRRKPKMSKATVTS